MNSATIQPTLTPCDGSIDLISSISGCGKFIELTWGATLFMRIPRDRQTASFRILAGLLCRLGFGQEAVGDLLGVCSKTVRRWKDCLATGTWDSLSVLFEGVHPRSLPDHLAQYARRRYREFVEAGQATPAYGYNRTIAQEIERYWGEEVCSEVLRRLFREEDLLMQMEAGQAQRTDDCECENGLSAESASAPNAMSVEAERTESCECENGLSAESAGAPNDVSVEAERTESCECENGLSAESAGAPHDVSGDVQEKGELRETTVRDGVGPALFDRPLSQPLLSAHAGLFILSPWFEKAFGDSLPIVRQTGAQILLGEVNQEQAKNLSFSCLEPFISAPIRSPQRQRQLLDEAVMADAVSSVWRANAMLIGLARCRTAYMDPHVAVYTGKENYVKTWSGLDKAPKKGVNLDFFHTADGYPCYIGHDDGYYDARQRFLMIIQQMRSTTGADLLLTFIMDRGFWGEEFMQAMIDLHLRFIQWQKNYKKDAWDEPFTCSGRMSIVRRKNHKHNKRKIRFSFREQVWPAYENGRRIIVRTRDLNGKDEEFAIVSNDPDLSTQEIVRLMFNRQIQEGDFSYQNRHFGINQQTARKTIPYAQLQDTLEDRQIDSREYLDRRQELAAHKQQLGKLLVTLAATSNPSPAALKARSKRLEARLEEINKQVSACDAATTKSGFIDKIGRTLARLTANVKDARRQQQQIDNRRALQAEADQLRQTLSDLNALIGEMSQKESRLNRMIQDRKVKPDLARKSLMDAIRITARNAFCQAHGTFRSRYNNHREDHATLRQLTRSPGVITQNADGSINIYLRPELDRQPEQWRRIRSFIDIVEHRIRRQFNVVIRIHLNHTDAQIFAAAARMSERLKSQNQRK